MNITFECTGGPLDGTVTGFWAEKHYHATKNGTVGCGFGTSSPHVIDQLQSGVDVVGPPHYYKVTERIEDGDDVLVRVIYVGNEWKTKKKI